MSLKRHLEKGPVKDFMSSNFPKFKPYIRDLDTGSIADWNSESKFSYVKAEKYFLLGTAYDTYIRCVLAQNNENEDFF